MGGGARYSSGKVTGPQRSSGLEVQTEDGMYGAPWSPPEPVENAHDQQGAATRAYVAPVSRNTSGTPAAPPVADR